MSGHESVRHRSSPVVGRRLRLIRLALAALVVTGAGAAATMAAWTDSTFFTTTVSSGTIDLQGAVDYLDPANPGPVPDGLDWQQFPGPDPANSGEIERFVPPAIDFQNLGPGQSRSATIWVRNAGSLPLGMLFDAADAADVSWTGANLFPDPPTVAVSAIDRNGTVVPSIDGWVLRGGDWLTITVTVTTPEDWAQENAGRAGQLALVLEATTEGVTTD
ncbi:hypothetical protein [Agromyces sp. Leaf222]|uniref:hypothetical protein n=1 Tax=Agromyces sp. Leaf222 TaxID=1735688 RepID=UPI0007012835|nr:hypothetical protein [Agromyces sp. Leaf222]KQM80720.1 hypothetical protein ASE68_19550 [Agromyces sp. Leaf222]